MRLLGGHAGGRTTTKFYLIRRLPNGHVDLHRADSGFDTTPSKTAYSPVDAPFATQKAMTVVAEYLLCDYFGDAQDGDVDCVALAKSLAPHVGHHLLMLASVRAGLKTNGNRSWTVAADEIGQRICKCHD